MSTRAQRYDAVVLSRVQLSPHLLRVTLSAPGLESTGIPDEWIGLVVPGQFQVRYYTVRSLDDDRLVIDVVVHEQGLVTDIAWPSGEGYFWMAGESAQMRAIRKHLMRDRRLPASAYDVMGYWRAASARQPRAVDPGPIYREGKAAGLSDEEIWAKYDDAQQGARS